MVVLILLKTSAVNIKVTQLATWTLTVFFLSQFREHILPWKGIWHTAETLSSCGSKAGAIAVQLLCVIWSLSCCMPSLIRYFILLESNATFGRCLCQFKKLMKFYISFNCFLLEKNQIKVIFNFNLNLKHDASKKQTLKGFFPYQCCHKT